MYVDKIWRQVRNNKLLLDSFTKKVKERISQILTGNMNEKVKVMVVIQKVVIFKNAPTKASHTTMSDGSQQAVGYTKTKFKY